MKNSKNQVPDDSQREVDGILGDGEIWLQEFQNMKDRKKILLCACWPREIIRWGTKYLSPAIQILVMTDVTGEEVIIGFSTLVSSTDMSMILEKRTNKIFPEKMAGVLMINEDYQVSIIKTSDFGLPAISDPLCNLAKILIEDWAKANIQNI